MRAAKKPSRLHLFPPNGTTPAEGHHFCAGGEGPEVLAFLDANMKR